MSIQLPEKNCSKIVSSKIILISICSNRDLHDR
jgi:hypothetical protein